MLNFKLSTLVNQLINFLVLNRKIKRSALSKVTKKALLKTNFFTFFLKQIDKKNQVASIAGYQVKYCNASVLSYLFTGIFVNQDYYFKTENPKPRIVDCGSNIGMSVLFFKMLYPAAEIIAFEPDIHAFSCLQKNVEINHFSSVKLYRKALSDREGVTDFYIDEKAPGSLQMSTRNERIKGQKQEIECTLLSNYIEGTVDFLKLDIEGAEIEVIKELAKAKKLKLVKQAIIEYHHHMNRGSDKFSEIIRILEQDNFGYQIQSRFSMSKRQYNYQDILIYAYQKD